MFKKNMPNANEKLAKTVTLFADGSNELYFDVTGTKPVDADSLKNLFLKGLIVVQKGTALYIPTAYASDAVSLVVMTGDVPAATELKFTLPTA